MSLIVALLLWSCAAEPAPASYPWEEVDRLQAQFDSLDAQLGKTLEGLEECRSLLAASPEDEGIELRRMVLKGQATEIVNSMDSVRLQYQRTLTEARVTALSRGMKKGRHPGGVSARDASPVVTRLLKYEADFSALTRKMKRFSEQLTQDEGAYAQVVLGAQSRRRSLQLWLRGILAVMLVTAALAAAFLLGRGRRQPLDTLAGQLALPQHSALDTAPVTPQGLAGNFTLLRVIGKGGMGVVYEAMDTALHRKVAIKKMREELLESPKDVERIMAEARMVAALRHPNIVEIYSIVRAQGLIYLVFEFVEGRNLYWLLESRKSLKYPQAVQVTKGIAAALDFAHSKKVVHRDLKPANVMLTTQGQVKVMDFGIAYQSTQTLARSTRAEAWGTPPYMAPEQELGQVSKEVDIYALGVCLYEMLTGRLPFSGPNFLAQKREELFIPPSGAASGLPKGIDAFFKRALAAEPSRRFQSGAELVAALPAP